MPENAPPTSGLLGPNGQPIQPTAQPPGPKSPPASTGSATPTTDPPSQYATAESVTKLVDQIGKLSAQNEQRDAEIRGYLQGMAQLQQPQGTNNPAPPPITSKDVNEALKNMDEGADVGETMRRFIDSQVNARTTQIEQQLQALSQYGAQNFTHFAEQGISQREYFGRFEKEIRAELDALDPRLKGNPQAWDYAYNLVVGRHNHELSDEIRAEAIRQARENPQPDPSAPPATPPAFTDGTPIPQAADLGADAAAALRGKKQTEDTFAQSLGYHDWAELQMQMETCKDPYEDDEFMFGKAGRNRGPSWKGNSFTRRAVR